MRNTLKFSPVFLSAVAAMALTGAGTMINPHIAFSQELPPEPTLLSGEDSGPSAPTPRPPEAAVPGESDVSPAPAPGPVTVVVPEAAPNVPPPDAALLQAPVETVTPMPDAIAGDSSVSKIPAPDSTSDAPDVYYDSSLNVPTGPLSETVGPRKVDPVQEPGSKLVIVRKNFDASDAEAQVVAANRALDLGRYESALEIFQELARKNDRDPRILMGLAVAQQKTGLNEQAIMTYESLLEIMPDNVDAIINLTGLIQEQYPEVAMRRLLDLSERFPSNGGIAAQMGMIHAESGNYEQALIMLGKAASLQPQNAGHFYNMAIVVDRTGKNRQQAINYYEQALEIDAVYGNGRSVPREAIYDRLSKLRRI